MSANQNGAPRAPKAVIEQAAPKAEPETRSPDAKAGRAKKPHAAGKAGRHNHAGHADSGLHDATAGLFGNLGRPAWDYACRHPHAALYGFVAFILAVLILVIGLWRTIIIAIFVAVGVAIGQTRDGDNAIVNFFSRLFGGRN